MQFLAQRVQCERRGTIGQSSGSACCSSHRSNGAHSYRPVRQRRSPASRIDPCGSLTITEGQPWGRL